MNITSLSEGAHNSSSRVQSRLTAWTGLTSFIANNVQVLREREDRFGEEEMRNQAEGQNPKMECNGRGSAFGFLVAGLGIGAVLSVFLAPRSGAETRKWIATRCLDGVEAANTRVLQARLRMHELVDQGQQKVTAAVAARREAVGEPKVEPKAEAV